MKKLAIILQPLIILLTIALLVLVLLDTLTYAWNTNPEGQASSNGGLRICTPWTFNGCKQLWRDMAIKHAIALIFHLCTIPVIVTMILIMTLATFTRVIRKRTAILISIICSWLVFVVLVATVVLRVTTYDPTKLTPPSIGVANAVPNMVFLYHKDWQMYVTLASLIVSFSLVQLIFLAGWIRPMTTMLSFDGHFQRYDYPRMANFEKSMVSVKELDSY